MLVCLLTFVTLYFAFLNMGWMADVIKNRESKNTAATPAKGRSPGGDGRNVI